MGLWVKILLACFALLGAVFVSSRRSAVPRSSRFTPMVATPSSSVSPSVSSAVSPSYKVTHKLVNIGGHIRRIPTVTGDAQYRSELGGGVVKTGPPHIIPAISDDEHHKRESIIEEWHHLMDGIYQELGYPTDPFDEFRRSKIDTPSSFLEEQFNLWKHQQREPLIRRWYQLMDEDYKRNMPYQTFQANLKGYTLAQIKKGYEEQKRWDTTSTDQAGPLPTAAEPQC